MGLRKTTRLPPPPSFGQVGDAMELELEWEWVSLCVEVHRYLPTYLDNEGRRKDDDDEGADRRFNGREGNAREHLTHMNYLPYPHT